jgi:hypothetical protein
MATEAQVGWQSSPQSRGTFDILWSCITVLLICTYTVIHPNLPARDERKAHWYQPPYLRAGLRQVKWMLIAAVAPEIVIAIAIEDWATAKSELEEMMNMGEPHWTMKHAFYAAMGGIALRFDGLRDRRPLPLYGPQVRRLKSRQFSITGGVRTEIMPRLSPQRLPIDDIQDRNKADAFVKGLAVLQSSWLVG